MKFEQDIELGKHRLKIKNKKNNVLIFKEEIGEEGQEVVIWLFDRKFGYDEMHRVQREIGRISSKIRWFTYEHSVEFVVPIDVFWEGELLKYAKSEKWISYKERIYPKDKSLPSYDPNPKGLSLFGNIFRKIKTARRFSIRRVLGIPTIDEWETSSQKGFVRKKKDK